MQGTCLCGAITVTAPDQTEVGACHCSMCRRWGGGPLLALHGGSDVHFTGATPSVYRSSQWAERGFCPHCGSHLFYRLVQSGEYELPAGLFQDAPLHLASDIFIDEKPAYYRFADVPKQLTGAEVFALFAPKPSE
ncbi:GFA family protein [Aeromonas simiae]|uniref:GFA family protein n=1 Tax=Aeromonas simiae TaxID=218936 RepID=A0A5J6WXC7_9GAMM|nr:GFA family protein [Aeromonas simiae]MDO2948874.1 GFA family protein [Aeromonas simiae]MDO2951978.1 GFA family protein [Aeromonas simiae]MDO2956257.1 GFA family protein [Aeromonas simiae]QFI54851.1 GFA family protein [Aeromonas simiae]